MLQKSLIYAEIMVWRLTIKGMSLKMLLEKAYKEKFCNFRGWVGSIMRGARGESFHRWYHSSRENLLVSEFVSWGRVLGGIVEHLIT